MINSYLFLGNLQPLEILLILGVILLIFGAKKLPEIGRAFGNGLKEFKKATKEFNKTIEESDEEENYYSSNNNKNKKLVSSSNKNDSKTN